jgi:hypothetical protein
MERFRSWCGYPELEPPKLVPSLQAVAAACDENGHWRGAALYVYENSGWTVFEDLSGQADGIPADSWLSFAESDDFVSAGYNHSNPLSENASLSEKLPLFSGNSFSEPVLRAKYRPSWA